ncbi:MAG: pentapeptide repeat-containing protein, partial [Ferrovibrio sp.]
MPELRFPPQQLTVALSRHAAWAGGRSEGERLQRRGEDLSFYRFDSAKLNDAVLSRCVLSGSSLVKAELRRADLFAVDLMRADLSGAILDRADLRGANMMKTVLRGASLNQAD